MFNIKYKIILQNYSAKYNGITLNRFAGINRRTGDEYRKTFRVLNRNSEISVHKTCFDTCNY